MKWKASLYLLIFFLCGGAIGLWVGQKTATTRVVSSSCQSASQGELDQFYTQVLQISQEQKNKILAIEEPYQKQRDQFTQRMHKANLHLANVIEQDGYTSSAIGPLVAEIHKAMGELQTLSLAHLAAIEKVLDSEQAELLQQRAIERLRQN